MMFADPIMNHKEWDFLTDFSSDRYHYFMNLSKLSEDKLTFAFHDLDTNKWTKRQGFYRGWRFNEYQTAFDIHRTMLPNEILIESDYPTYEENYEAIRIVGKIIEGKGFTPNYFFSGNKSIHLHVFMNFKCLINLPMELQEKIMATFKFKGTFVNAFMKWLRGKMVSCWDTQIRQFDTNFTTDSHLIRAELSRNKLGYKTFLGHSYKDLPPVAYVCNETTGFLPRLGEAKLSSPQEIEGMVREFLRDKELKSKKLRVTHIHIDLRNFSPENKTIKPSVNFILSDEFRALEDGTGRAMFILVNELKKVYTPEVALPILMDWNSRMGNPVKPEDITYRMNMKDYALSEDYINKFLESLGVPPKH